MNDTATAELQLDIDPVTASVIQGALENIAVEMGYKLMRMSYSSIIRESEDFGAGLVDTRGRGLAESTQSTPLQSGPIPGYVRGMLKALEDRPWTGCRVYRAGIRRWQSYWLFGHHSTSSGYRSPVPGQLRYRGRYRCLC